MGRYRYVFDLGLTSRILGVVDIRQWRRWWPGMIDAENFRRCEVVHLRFGSIEIGVDRTGMGYVDTYAELKSERMAFVQSSLTRLRGHQKLEGSRFLRSTVGRVRPVRFHERLSDAMLALLTDECRILTDDVLSRWRFGAAWDLRIQRARLSLASQSAFLRTTTDSNGWDHMEQLLRRTDSCLDVVFLHTDRISTLVSFALSFLAFLAGMMSLVLEFRDILGSRVETLIFLTVACSVFAYVFLWRRKS